MTTEIKGDGPDKIMDVAEGRAPPGDGLGQHLAVALGTAEVSPLSQAGAYATFATVACTWPTTWSVRSGTPTIGSSTPRLRNSSVR